jgi:hypothetical protein
VQIGVPTLLALAYSRYAPSEEEKQRVLEEKYPHLVKHYRDRRQQFQAVFDKARNDDPEQQKRFQVLIVHSPA